MVKQLHDGKTLFRYEANIIDLEEVQRRATCNTVTYGGNGSNGRDRPMAVGPGKRLMVPGEGATEEKRMRRASQAEA